MRVPDAPPIPLSDFLMMSSISRGGVKSMITINETSHLRGTGLPMGLFQKG